VLYLPNKFDVILNLYLKYSNSNNNLLKKSEIVTKIKEIKIATNLRIKKYSNKTIKKKQN
jgi:hypothetical protein